MQRIENLKDKMLDLAGKRAGGVSDGIAVKNIYPPAEPSIN